MTLLQLNASIYGEAGQSTRLANDFVSNWRLEHPDARVIVRDLARDPVPHLTAERFQAFITAPAQRNAAQREIVAYSDSLIDELRQAEIIVLGLPMYNYDVPSTLKAYFDHIARAGVTFRYTQNGPVGLLTGKKMYVLATRGGYYAGTPDDTQTAYVRQFFRLLGIDAVEFVYAEGLAIGDAAQKSALSNARRAIERLHRPDREALAA
ncbi:MAG TPA: NAD(P)H-dependent oxidoreductase [Burkholderiales bacterium]|nr:NAD(P)H-dependent oxidoreductase [Burkholderiales bacterium]